VSVHAETLKEAWQLALSHDQTLAAANADVAAAEANERAAHGARWPSLDAKGGYTRLNASPTRRGPIGPRTKAVRR
jgi:outer membrane protein TolC